MAGGDGGWLGGGLRRKSGGKFKMVVMVLAEMFKVRGTLTKKTTCFEHKLLSVHVMKVTSS